MPRTTSLAVTNLLGVQWDGVTDPLAAGFNDLAASMVNDAVNYDYDHVLDSGRQELLERYLTAHCYLMMDQAYQAKMTGGKASATFQGKTDMGLNGTKYGQMAMMADPSGYFRALQNKGICNMVYLGNDCDDECRAGTSCGDDDGLFSYGDEY